MLSQTGVYGEAVTAVGFRIPSLVLSIGAGRTRSNIWICRTSNPSDVCIRPVIDFELFPWQLLLEGQTGYDATISGIRAWWMESVLNNTLLAVLVWSIICVWQWTRTSRFFHEDLCSPKATGGATDVWNTVLSTLIRFVGVSWCLKSRNFYRSDIARGLHRCEGEVHATFICIVGVDSHRVDVLKY